MLKINNLHATVSDKPILNGLTLNVKPGEVHAIMGPNGAGKSTLGNVLTGRDDYQVHDGNVEFDGKDLFGLTPAERAQQGLFLAFQYPVEIPGINNTYFLRTAYNHQLKARGEPELEAVDFMKKLREKAALVGIEKKLLNRDINVGFSGGEKKRNEVLQMLLFEPKCAILDEMDSGLDIDALQTVANGVNCLRDGQRSFVIITHYQRLLNYIEPDFVHVLANGKIIKSGDKSLALELEQKGYGWLTEA